MRLEVTAGRSDPARRKVFAFRYRVYATELGLPVGAADRARSEIVDGLDEHSVSYAVGESRQVVGELRFTCLADVPDPADLIASFVMAPAIEAFGRAGNGLASRLLLDPTVSDGTSIPALLGAVHEAALERGVRLLHTACSPHLVPFFEHLGFRHYTEALVAEPGRFRVPLVMLVRDRDYLDRIRSPLVSVVARQSTDPEAATWFARTFPQYAVTPRPALLPADVFFSLLAARVAGDPLHAVGLFRGLGPEETERVLARATVVRTEPGERIVRQGEQGDALYVLLAGVAEVRLKESPNFPIALLGAGDSFGEIAFLTARRRTADVVARTNCEAIALSGTFLRSFLTVEPLATAKLLLNLASTLAERLSDTTRDAALST